MANKPKCKIMRWVTTTSALNAEEFDMSQAVLLNESCIVGIAELDI